MAELLEDGEVYRYLLELGILEDDESGGVEWDDLDASVQDQAEDATEEFVINEATVEEDIAAFGAEEFSIEIMNYGPVYFIRASEFDDIGYFASCDEAKKEAVYHYDSFIHHEGGNCPICGAPASPTSMRNPCDHLAFRVTRGHQKGSRTSLAIESDQLCIGTQDLVFLGDALERMLASSPPAKLAPTLKEWRKQKPRLAMLLEGHSVDSAIEGYLKGVIDSLDLEAEWTEEEDLLIWSTDPAELGSALRVSFESDLRTLADRTPSP